jgi:Fic-DOC domain mobile mystery protein B
MSSSTGGSPEIFSVRTIGPEPTGATPLDDDDLRGLIPHFVATRSDLNQVEFENITSALPWAREQALSRGPDGVLDLVFMLSLHKRMFGDVWSWAGTLRQRLTNIRVEPHEIATQSTVMLENARYWHEHNVFETDCLAARIHCRLVNIHPFPNGNGRCTRMMADLYLTSIGIEPFTWGGETLDVDGSGRAEYIAALVKADRTDDYSDLIGFARASSAE